MKRKYKIDKKFIASKTTKGTTIFDVDTSTFYSFNKTGTDIINFLRKEKTEEEITGFLSKKYSISDSRAKKDVNDFLKELRANKIVSSLRQKPRKQ